MGDEMDRKRLGLVLGTALVLVMASRAVALTLPLGYLAPASWPDAAKILTPPPTTGSAREAQDQSVFVATRALEGSPRWALAQNDVSSLPDAMLKNFSCAVGVDLTPQTSPKLNNMMTRIGIDAGRQVTGVKEVFKRPRPYLITPGNICVAKTDALAASPDYPSGHATWGWALGLILAEIAPDRATPILVRGRVFGESRVICGVHSPSAVEAGRTNAASLVAALHGNADFRQDLEGVRGEMAALRKSAPASTRACADEAALIAKAPY